MATEDENLTICVEATLARIAALNEADEQLERRRQALRAMHAAGITRGEVFRRLNNELRDRGLTDADLAYSGVSYDSIQKVLAAKS